MYQGILEMNIDHILGILIILGAYVLTWYLLLKSIKIVNSIAKQDSKHARKTESGLNPEEGAVRDI